MLLRLQSRVAFRAATTVPRIGQFPSSIQRGIARRFASNVITLTDESVESSQLAMTGRFFITRLLGALLARSSNPFTKR